MMKKLSRHIVLLSAAALAVAGCVKEKMPSEYTLGFEVKTASFVSGGQQPTLSPVVAGTALGVLLFDGQGNTLLDESPYTVATAGVVSGINTPSTGGFTAALFSPAHESAADPSAIPFTHGDDVIWGSVESDRSLTLPVVMSHLCSQVTFEVRDADGNPATEASIEVGGFFDGATLDAQTGMLTPSATTTAKVTALDTPVCVFPSRAGTPHSLKARITIAGSASEFDFDHLFEPGAAYLITLTRTGVTATLTDWTDAGQLEQDIF